LDWFDVDVPFNNKKMPTGIILSKIIQMNLFLPFIQLSAQLARNLSDFSRVFSLGRRKTP
jgi:hypothetical protein